MAEITIYDPNGVLTDGELHWALSLGAKPFRDCGIEPELVTSFPCKTLLIGMMGNKKYIAYVRFTRSNDEEVGLGPTPQVLIDAAKSLEAEPYILRVAVSTKKDTISFAYWGFEKLVAALKSNVDEWQNILLKGKTPQYFLRLKKGLMNKIEINVIYSPEFQKHNQKGMLSLSMLIDGKELYKAAIDLENLIRSCVCNDELEIFTCTCGEPGCADIDRGVIVAHKDDLTVWKVYGISPRKIIVFNRKHYTEEILMKTRRFLEIYHQHSPAINQGVYFQNIKRVEDALNEAEKGLPIFPSSGAYLGGISLEEFNRTGKEE
jgi:hypothetical protein